MNKLYISILIIFQTSVYSQNHISTRHVDCYKIGQVICFESSDKKTDTIQIRYIDPIEDRIWGQISTSDSNIDNKLHIEFTSIDTCYLAGDDDTSGYEITSIELKKIINTGVNSEKFIFLNYKEFWPDIKTEKGIIYKTFLGNMHTDTLKANGKNITNYYLIKSYNYTKKKIPTYRTKNSHIDFFIWTDSKGLTAYKTKKGIWWTIKSSS